MDIKTVGVVGAGTMRQCPRLRPAWVQRGAVRPGTPPARIARSTGCVDILRVREDGLGDPKYRPCPLLLRMVDAGWRGMKSGRGFYTY